MSKASQNSKKSQAPTRPPTPPPPLPSQTSSRTPYKELNVQNKTNYAILMKTPKSSKKKIPSPDKVANTSYKSQRSYLEDDDVESRLDERSGLLSGMNQGNGRAYGTVQSTIDSPGDDGEGDASPKLRLVYKPSSPKPQKRAFTLSSSASASASPQSTQMRQKNEQQHHQHIKTAYDLTPKQLQHHYQHWHEEDLNHEKVLQKQIRPQPQSQPQPESQSQSQPHSIDKKNQTAPIFAPLPVAPPPVRSPSDDNWAVGEDLELQQKGNAARSPPEEEFIQPSPRSMERSTGQATTKNTLTPSTSLLDLVWKNQAVKREKKLRSMSDLSDDTSSVIKGSPSRAMVRANSGNANSSAIPGLPPIPPTPLSETSSPRIAQPTRNNDIPIIDLSRGKQHSLPLPIQLPQSLPFSSAAVPLLSKLSQLPQETSTATEEVTTEYLVLDFSEVKGVDATAARSCFLTLVHLMRNASVKIVFASVSKDMEHLLRSHRVIDDDSILIPDIDDALEWCEDQVIASIAEKRQQLGGRSSSLNITTAPSSSGTSAKQVQDYVNASKQRQLQSQLKTPRLSMGSTSTDNASVEEVKTTEQQDQILLSGVESGKPTSQQTKTLRAIVEDYLEIDTSLLSTVSPSLTLGISLDAPLQQISALLDGSVLIKYFERQSFTPYHLIYDIDDLAEKVYFIESGNVELVTMSLMQLEQSRWQQQQSLHILQASSSSSADEMKVKRVNKVCSGGIFGESDFFLARNHSLRAYTTSDSVCWTLTRDQFSAMELHHPQLCMLIQYTLLKSLSIASTCAMYSLHPTTASTATDV